MRDVNAVKETRNKLRNELSDFIVARKNFYQKEIAGKKEYDKTLYGYIISSIDRLSIQINTIEYILNEDTEIGDVTEPWKHYKECGIEKIRIMTYVNNEEIQ